MTDSNPTTEEWRPVPGYEGLYEVSNLGRVRSFYRCRFGECRLLRLVSEKDGYQVVTLRRDMQNKLAKVHRLVAAAFIPRADPSFTQVNHLDGCKSNNVVSNLEWTDQLGNAKHAAATGLLATGERSGPYTKPERVARGDAHPCAVLTTMAVREIRSAYRDGALQVDLASRYGVNQKTISSVVLRKTWEHVE